MFSIHLTTFIKAPAKLVFDLSRNTTVFRKALEGRNEILTANASSILLNVSDTITLSAKHLGKTRMMTLRITEMDEPQKFVEEQVKGDLKSFRHEHHFKEVDNGSLLIDLVYMEEPRDAGNSGKHAGRGGMAIFDQRSGSPTTCSATRPNAFVRS